MPAQAEGGAQLLPQLPLPPRSHHAPAGVQAPAVVVLRRSRRPAGVALASVTAAPQPAAPHMHTPSSSADESSSHHGGGGGAGKPKGRVLIDAAAGAIAGCIARFCVGPLDVIKIRFQVQLEPIRQLGADGAAAKPLPSKYTGFRQALTTILREEGVQVGQIGWCGGRRGGVGGTVPWEGVPWGRVKCRWSPTSGVGCSGVGRGPLSRGRVLQARCMRCDVDASVGMPCRSCITWRLRTHRDGCSMACVAHRRRRHTCTHM